MTATKLLAVVVAGWIALILYYHMIYFIRVKQRWQQAMARRYWAEAREDLFRLVVANRMSPHTAVFQSVFRLQSMGLRDDRTAIDLVNELQRAILTHDPQIPPAWVVDPEQWPFAMRTVLERTAQGAHLQALAYPGLGAAVARFCLRWPPPIL